MSLCLLFCKLVCYHLHRMHSRCACRLGSYTLVYNLSRGSDFRKLEKFLATISEDMLFLVLNPPLVLI